MRTAVWVLVAALIGVGGFDLYRFLLHSEFFGLRQIEIEGCVQVPQQEIEAMVNIPLGTNVFHIQTGSMVERLQMHPWIEKVQVARRLPNRLAVVLTERKPVVAVNSVFDGQVYGIDRDLVILPEPQSAAIEASTASAAFDLPIVTGLKAEEIYPGNRLQNHPAKKVMKAVLLLQTLNENFLQQLSEINIDEGGNITLYPLCRADVVYLGCEHLERRTWRMCQVWDYLETYDIDTRYIDCRFDMQGVVTCPENLTQSKWDALPRRNRNLSVAEIGTGI